MSERSIEFGYATTCPRRREDSGPGQGSFKTASIGHYGFDTLQQGLPDSIYVLIEKFDDFKKVGAMTLPHSYTMDYSVEGQGHTFIAKWTMKAVQWAFNRDL